MCYSAQLQQRFKTIKEMLKAEADYAKFGQVFEARLSDDSIKIPKALEANFYNAKTPTEKRILDSIRQYQDNKTKELEVELFKQKKRLADAERKLKTKETKKALDDQRIASNKIKWHTKKIADLTRTELKASDSRISNSILAASIDCLYPPRFGATPIFLEALSTAWYTLSGFGKVVAALSR